jgi:NADH-quinone oxidoreductase subunit G
VPELPGRDVDAILRAAAEGSLAALLVGGVDPADAPDPGWAHEALARAGFIVSLELRRSAVTEHADVVLPVAPAAEKAGRYVTWEGRRRPFDLTITGTGALSDARVLDALAEELDVPLGLRSVDAARAELLRLGTVTSRPAMSKPAAAEAADAAGELQGRPVRLATWAELLDAGRMQDGDEYLAGTARPVLARLSAATAAALEVTDGELVTVATQRGAIRAPAQIVEMPEDVVWLPTNARGSGVRRTLAAAHGSTVGIAKSRGDAVRGEESFPYVIEVPELEDGEGEAAEEGGES